VPNSPKGPPAAPAKKPARAYPFDGLLEIAGAKKPITVLFVNKDGLIARLDSMFVHVGEHYKIQFELPITERTVFTEVRVMKTYDRALDAKVSKVERMAEFRFEKLIDDHRSYLSTFMTTIGQNK
jgi:hypothetical protein